MIRMFLTLVVALIVATAAHAQAPAMQPPAPTPAQMKQAQQMMALMQEAIKPLTTADVENFLSAVTAFEKWVKKDVKRLAMFRALSPPMRQAKIKELLGDKAGHMGNLLVLVGRVKIAEQVAQPGERAKMKQKLVEAKKQMALASERLAQMPPAMQQQLKAQMASGLKMLEAAANYPDSGIAVYKKNEARIKAGVARLEAIDEKKASAPAKK